ncbi:MAG: DUF3833 domain-containing protein [Proteobacteria bacterium]|nr:DUF3833 domain-containing protein [Pseudomonadota bacterium]
MAKVAPLFLALALAGACAQPPAPTRSEPRFVPEQWFQGRTVGRGEFRRSLGGSPSRFDMVIDGAWNGRVLTMDETFSRPAGAARPGRWNRVWTITPTGRQSYLGELTTGHGPAEITAEGDTVTMRYRADAPLVERPFPARFEQTLRLRPDGTVLNTADVYKWGVRIGRTTVVFRKAPGGA